MEYVDGNVRLSAGDLVNHLFCRHLTVLNSEVAAGVRAASKDWDPTVALMRERGLAHERNYLEHLEDIGHHMTQIEGVGVNAEAVSATVEAMRNGAEVIVQAALTCGRWTGRIDALLCVQKPSCLGRPRAALSSSFRCTLSWSLACKGCCRSACMLWLRGLGSSHRCTAPLTTQRITGW